MKIEPIIDGFFLFKMLEFVHGTKLINGEKYFVKSYNDKDRIIKFLEYEMLGNVEIAVCIHINRVIYLFTDLNRYYRYVKKEEYLEKVKEKYDAKCLDIVLKRLVNENFEW